MDGRRLDNLAVRLATSPSRRRLLAALAGGALGGLLGRDGAAARCRRQFRSCRRTRDCCRRMTCTEDFFFPTRICKCKPGYKDKDGDGRCEPCLPTGAQCESSVDCCPKDYSTCNYVLNKGPFGCGILGQRKQCCGYIKASCAGDCDCCGALVCRSGQCCTPPGEQCTFNNDCCSGSCSAQRVCT